MATSLKKKNIADVVKAIKDEENKSILLKNNIQTELNKASSLLKLLQLKQAKMKGKNDGRKDPAGSKKWFGAPLPPVDSVQSLCQMLNKDLKSTELFTGCSIVQCNVELLSESKDEIRRQYDATCKIEDYEFDLQFESVFQVMTGEERVSTVANIVFRPSHSELLPLQHYLQRTASTHILPRALRTVQDIIQEQGRLHQWASTQERLEIVTSSTFIVLQYVPYMLMGKRKRPGDPVALPPSPAKTTRARLMSIKKEKKSVSSDSVSASPEKEEPAEATVTLDSEEEILGEEEDDHTVHLKWTFEFSEARSKILSSFALTPTDGVLVRYSSSPIEPLLTKEKMIKTCDDVIRLFSAFTH